MLTLVPFDQVTYGGIANTTSDPPDPIAAAGPFDLIAMVNSQIALFDKGGQQQAQVSLATFFSSVHHNFGLFDPWILYDRYDQRFIAIAEEVEAGGGGNEAYVLIGVSRTNNPNSLGTNDWWFFSVSATFTFNSQLTWIDYPKIAADEDDFYITGNYYPFPFMPRSDVQGVVITRLDKAPMLQGQDDTTPTRIGIIGPFTLQPAQSVGRLTTQPQLFVDAVAGAGIRVWELDDNNNLGVTPVLSGTGFDAFTGQAPQQSTADTLATLSSRLMSAVWRNNSLWTTHTVDDGGRAAVRWYQITTSAGYSAVQADTFTEGAGIHTFMPAIAVDEAGNAAIVYTQSSTTQNPQMRFAWRRASEAINTMHDGGVIQGSGTSYNRNPSSTDERWGDYGGIALDPTDDATFWAFHEYVVDDGGPAGSSVWGTRWGAFTVNADLPAVYDAGAWRADLEGNGGALGTLLRNYGTGQHLPVPGDWNNDSLTELAVRDGTIWRIDTDDNGSEDETVNWGASDDIPFAGDWDGDGDDDLILFVPTTATWRVNYNAGAPSFFDNLDDVTLTPNCTPFNVSCARPGDIPAVGDWNGDGRDEGWRLRPRKGKWYVDYNQNGGAAEVTEDNVYTMWLPLSGDWNNAGRSEPWWYRGGAWQFETDRDLGSAPLTRNFGGSRHIPVSGDWNGNGEFETWVYLDGQWFVDINKDGNTGGPDDPDDEDFSWGDETFVPLSGDWNANGLFETWVFNDGGWTIDLNQNHMTDAGESFSFGDSTFIPLSGDWNGDNLFETWLFKPATAEWLIDVDQNHKIEIGQGKPDRQFVWGLPTDIPLTGDWNGDGKSEPWIFRRGGATWLIDYNQDQGNPEFTFTPFGDRVRPVPGDWNRDSRDEIGIAFNNLWTFDMARNWDGFEDSFTFEGVADVPVVGRWRHPTGGGGGLAPSSGGGDFSTVKTVNSTMISLSSSGAESMGANVSTTSRYRTLRGPEELEPRTLLSQGGAWILTGLGRPDTTLALAAC